MRERDARSLMSYATPLASGEPSISNRKNPSKYVYEPMVFALNAYEKKVTPYFSIFFNYSTIIVMLTQFLNGIGIWYVSLLFNCLDLIIV